MKVCLLCGRRFLAPDWRCPACGRLPAMDIGDHVFIASHTVVSGHVNIGECCFIGVNATLRNSTNIAPHTLVGAGAVIMKDTIEKGVYLSQRATLFDTRSDEIEW